MRKLLINILLVIGVLLSYTLKAQQHTGTSLQIELKKLTSFSALPAYSNRNPVKSFSSYDRTGNNDDGFSGKYSFIRKEKDSSLVIFEDSGSGVINRIWTPTPTSDSLLFYFGGNKAPSFAIKFADLFSGKVYPFITPLVGNQVGGYFCYLPIPYQNGCKIIYKGKKLEFYQIQYQSSTNQQNVKTFNPNLSTEEKATLANISQQWANPKASLISGAKEITINEILNGGETLMLANFMKGGRILGIEIENASQFSGNFKQIDLKITWDNENIPAVYLPLADFFGYAFGTPAMQSLLLGTANNLNYCYFPMPFDQTAKLELIYRKGAYLNPPLKINGKIYYTTNRRDKVMEGKFYAYWNHHINKLQGSPHIFLEGKGKGHYVGTILQAQGLNPGMTLFFEGDDYTAIDGKQTIHGTGSEDYFNGGWYALLDRWDKRMSLPLHGALTYSLPFSRTGGYRLFLTDKMPFEQSILHTIEYGPELNNKPAIYTSVALYYAERAIVKGETPSNEKTKIYLPNTFMLYPQLMDFSFNGAITIDGNNFIAKNGGQIRIDLKEIPEGRYKLYGDLTFDKNGAEVTFWQRQSPVSDTLSFYSLAKVNKSQFYLCDLLLDNSRSTVTLHIKSDKEKNTATIQKFILVKQ